MKTLLKLLGGILGGLFLLTLLMPLGAVFFQLIGAIGFGWLMFLFRVLPQVQPSWSAIAFTMIVSLLVVGGVQWLGRALWRPASGARWPWRWSLGLYGGLWLLFLTAMGVTGAVHQAVWLGTSDRPWSVSNSDRFRYKVRLRATVQALDQAATLGEWEMVKLKTVLAEINYLSLKEDLFERHTVAFFREPEGGKLRAILVIPNEAESLKKAGFARLTRVNGDDLDVFLPAEKLPEVLRELNSSLP